MMCCEEMETNESIPFRLVLYSTEDFFKDREIPDSTCLTVTQRERQRAGQVLQFLPMRGRRISVYTVLYHHQNMAGKLNWGRNLGVITSIIPCFNHSIQAASHTGLCMQLFFIPVLKYNLFNLWIFNQGPYKYI